MVDKAVLAAKIAVIRDAVDRIRTVIPPTNEAFLADRTSREVVVLNLFVAVQECVSLAAHWLADEGRDVPATYGELFRRLGEHGVIPGDLAARLSAASGFRNLVAHQYGVLDWSRIHTLASEHLDDLLTFCEALAHRAD
ncbi:MAG: type VII toxin-antitoxin system HepT family RNase toxin [Acidobacteriota bacterium]